MDPGRNMLSLDEEEYQSQLRFDLIPASELPAEDRDLGLIVNI